MGATLYYLLTGKYPFNFPTPLDILKFQLKHKARVKSPNEAFRMILEEQKLKTPHLIVLTEEPIPIQKRVPQIHTELARIVDKAIRKDINQRFQTATDFKRELESVVRKI
jgi:serine/threonine protein kinase